MRKSRHTDAATTLAHHKKNIRQGSKQIKHYSKKTGSQNNNKQSSQVRIIGGRYKRQNLKFIDAEGLRPTPDRLRETIFNWLMPYLYDAKVLDTCAGSGALGFEALSRGAVHITLIEANNKQAQCLQQSATQLKLDPKQYHIIHGEAQTVIHLESVLKAEHKSTSNNAAVFDLVFIDPPYALELWQPILLTLIENQYIDTTTLLYIEDTRPLNETLPQLYPLIEVIKQTKVGQITASLIQFNQLQINQ